eukprot:361360-Chlamydomonas_euryale.AAC.1
MEHTAVGNPGRARTCSTQRLGSRYGPHRQRRDRKSTRLPACLDASSATDGDTSSRNIPS